MSGGAFCICNKFYDHHSTIERASGKYLIHAFPVLSSCDEIAYLLVAQALLHGSRMNKFVLKLHCQLLFIRLRILTKPFTNIPGNTPETCKVQFEISLPWQILDSSRWHFVSAQGQSLCNFIWLLRWNQLFSRCILGPAQATLRFEQEGNLLGRSNSTNNLWRPSLMKRLLLTEFEIICDFSRWNKRTRWLGDCLSRRGRETAIRWRLNEVPFHSNLSYIVVLRTSCDP